MRAVPLWQHHRDNEMSSLISSVLGSHFFFTHLDIFEIKKCFPIKRTHHCFQHSCQSLLPKRVGCQHPTAERESAAWKKVLETRVEPQQCTRGHSERQTTWCEKSQKLTAQPESFRKARLEWEGVLGKQPKLLHCFSGFLYVKNMVK